MFVSVSLTGRFIRNAIFSAAMIVAASFAAQAATITVNSLLDTQANDGACTLREAIINSIADDQSGSRDCTAGTSVDTIRIPLVGTISLLTPLPAMTNEVTITGLDATQTIVRRDPAAATEFRIFELHTPAQATISSITIRDGIVRGANGTVGTAARGGGIFIDGADGFGTRLTLRKVIVTNNQAIGGDGAAGAGGDAFGGGIFAYQNVFIVSSIIDGNTARGGAGTTSGGSARGGAVSGVIYDASVVSSILRNNLAVAGTGALPGGNAEGGAIEGNLRLTVTASILENNRAVANPLSSSFGGAMSVFRATVSSTTFNANQATGGLGGHAGAINSTGSLTLTGSTLSNNTADGSQTAGALDSAGPLVVQNSTFSGNSVTGPGGMSGGAIWNKPSFPIAITNVTITNNSAAGPGSASGIFRVGGNTTLLNTIVAGNVNNALVPDTASDPTGIGAFVSQGHNLIGNPGTVTAFNQPGDQAGTAVTPRDPRLTPLGNYGGLTYTHALIDMGAATSPAINAGDPSNGTGLDQRGAGRIGVPDIGAYEWNPLGFRAQLPGGIVGVPYDQTITPESGFFTYLQLSGTLPPGLVFLGGGPPLITRRTRERSGLKAENILREAPMAGRVSIQGTPTTVGSYQFNITVADGLGSTTLPYGILINGPTAAGVTVSGRVLNSEGRGIANASVSLTAANGEVYSAITNRRGLFTINDIPSGATYVSYVEARRFTFAARVIVTNDSVSDLEFVAEP